MRLLNKIFMYIHITSDEFLLLVTIFSYILLHTIMVLLINDIIFDMHKSFLWQGIGIQMYVRAGDLLFVLMSP